MGSTKPYYSSAITAVKGQIRQNLKLVTVKITNAPKNPFDFKSVIPTGDLVLFSRHTGTLVGKFARVTDPKFRGI